MLQSDTLGWKFALNHKPKFFKHVIAQDEAVIAYNLRNKRSCLGGRKEYCRNKNVGVKHNSHSVAPNVLPNLQHIVLHVCFRAKASFFSSPLKFLLYTAEGC